MLRSSQPPTIVRPSINTCFAFSFYRDAFAALNVSFLATAKGYELISMCRPPSYLSLFLCFRRMEMPVATAPRGHVYTRIDNLRALDTFSRTYCYDSTVSPFACWFAIERVLSSIQHPASPCSFFRAINLAILSTNRAKLARDIVAISIRWYE